MSDFASDSLHREVRTVEYAAELDVPESSETLTDGTAISVYGDLGAWQPFLHAQGDTVYADAGMVNTCGLSNIEAVINRFAGHEVVSETSLIEHAAQEHHCDITNGGMTSMQDISEIFREHNLEAHVEARPRLDSLMDDVQNGHGVVLEVNSAMLDGSASYAIGCNHTISLVAVAKDSVSGEGVGAYYFDPLDGKVYYASKDGLENAMASAVVVEGRTPEEYMMHIGGKCCQWSPYY